MAVATAVAAPFAWDYEKEIRSTKSSPDYDARIGCVVCPQPWREWKAMTNGKRGSGANAAQLPELRDTAAA